LAGTGRLTGRRALNLSRLHQHAEGAAKVFGMREGLKLPGGGREKPRGDGGALLPLVFEPRIELSAGDLADASIYASETG
jgi:hypothetical protein